MGVRMIEVMQIREPVSALTHGAWVLFCIPATVLLMRRTRNDKLKSIGLLVYGLTMLACFASSCLFHSVWGSERIIEACRSLDHVCIFLFIAGTCTPIALVFMEKRWRFMFLSSMWFFSCAGISVIVSGTTMPLYVRTTVYLMLGWMGLFLYIQLLKKLPERKARPFMMGGIIYSLGAAFNLAHQPVIIPGLIGPHEVFHLVVILGSLTHYYFMIKTLASYSKPLDFAMEMYDNPILIGNDASCLQEMPISRKSA